LVQRPRRSVGIDYRDVLDAHAEAAGKIDARLDGKSHARLEGLPISVHEVRVFVTIEAYPVPGPMDAELPVTGVVDHAPSRRIDGLGGCVLAGGAVAGLLGPPDHVVDPLFL